MIFSLSFFAIALINVLDATDRHTIRFTAGIITNNTIAATDNHKKCNARITL
jgi:hypothetical protein